MKLVLPIAGRGSRFKKEAHRKPEYADPKPLILVRGYPMVRWATGSLPFVEHKGEKKDGKNIIRSSDIIFIALQEHEDQYQITERLKEFYGDGIHVVLIPDVTRGAAETALQAKPYINQDEPVIISDSDHFFDGQALAEVMEKEPDLGGIIPVFQVPEGDTKWSFSRLGENGYVDKVAEKEPISRWANIGGYYFGSGKQFVDSVESMIKNNEMVNNEFYVAPVYNKILQKGAKVQLAFPKYVYGLGTPADLEHFLANTQYTLS